MISYIVFDFVERCGHTSIRIYTMVLAIACITSTSRLSLSRRIESFFERGENCVREILLVDPSHAHRVLICYISISLRIGRWLTEGCELMGYLYKAHI